MALVVAVLLLAANAFFVGAEFALVSARRSRMEELAAAGSRRARQALAGMRDISMILAGAQLGVALASLGLGAITEPALERVLSHWLGLAGLSHGAGRPLAFAVTLLIVAGAHVTLGEMVPKNLAIAGPERAATWLGPPIVVFTRVTRPVLWLFNVLANAGLRTVGVRPTDEISHGYTADDLAAMTRRSHHGGMLDAVESGLAQAALELERRTVADVMTAWADVVTVPADVTAVDLERVAAETGFTRYPVAEPRIGWYLHVKAALRVGDDERSARLPESQRHPLVHTSRDTPLPELLARMRRSHSHLALVGEPERPLGIVSFDDVLVALNPTERAASR